MNSDSKPHFVDASRHQAFISFLRDPFTPESFFFDPLRCLIDHGFSLEDAQYLVQEQQNIFVYHAMLRNTMRDVLRAWLPRCHAILGQQRLVESIDRFLTQSKPKSPFLRMIPQEFVKWIEDYWKTKLDIPPFAIDLARFDILEQDIRNDPRNSSKIPCPKLELELPVCCNNTAELLQFSWKVNTVPRKPEPGHVPRPGKTCLLAFRGQDDQAKFLEVSPFCSQLFGRLQTGHSLRNSLEMASAEIGKALNDSLLAQAALALAEWMDKGAIFGAQKR